jgi:hypothetical protein
VDNSHSPSKHGARGARPHRAQDAAFEIERLSDDARRRMASSLSEVGLHLDPPLESVDRRDMVVLSSTGTDTTGASSHQRGESTTLADVLTIRAATPGTPLRTLDLDDLAAPTAQEIRWCNIEDSRNVSAAEVLATLNPHCSGQLTADMIEDLVSPDPRPKVKLWGSGSIRGVAAFQVRAPSEDELLTWFALRASRSQLSAVADQIDPVTADRVRLVGPRARDARFPR